MKLHILLQILLVAVIAVGTQAQLLDFFEGVLNSVQDIILLPINVISGITLNVFLLALVDSINENLDQVVDPLDPFDAPETSVSTSVNDGTTCSGNDIDMDITFSTLSGFSSLQLESLEIDDNEVRPVTTEIEGVFKATGDVSNLILTFTLDLAGTTCTSETGIVGEALWNKIDIFIQFYAKAEGNILELDFCFQRLDFQRFRFNGYKNPTISYETVLGDFAGAESAITDKLIDEGVEVFENVTNIDEVNELIADYKDSCISELIEELENL